MLERNHTFVLLFLTFVAGVVVARFLYRRYKA